MSLKNVSTQDLRKEYERLGRGLHALFREGVKSKDPVYRKQYGRIYRIECELYRRGELKIYPTK